MVSSSREGKTETNLIYLFSEEKLTNMDTNIGSSSHSPKLTNTSSVHCSYLQSSFLNSDLAKDSGTFGADGSQLIFIEGEELCSIQHPEAIDSPEIQSVRTLAEGCKCLQEKSAASSIILLQAFRCVP